MSVVKRPSRERLQEIAVERRWSLLECCPVCRSAEWEPLFEGRAQCVLNRCRRCATVFLNPRPAKQSSTSSGYDLQHARAKYLPRMVQQGFVSEDYRPNLQKLYGRYKKLVDLASSLAPTEPVVDIGCAIGLSMMAMSFKSIRSIGFDVDDGFIDVAREVFQLDVRKVDVFDKSLPDRYPIATANSVMEHIDQPVEFLKAIAENILQPRGALIVTAPNLMSTQFLQKGAEWEMISGGHVWYPTEETLGHVARLAGYEVEKVYAAQTDQVYASHSEFYIREILGVERNLTGGVGLILRAAG